MALSLASLLVQETKEQIYAYALGVAESLGLPVSSWQAGDPTRSLYHVESRLLATLEGVVAGYIRSAFLDYAEGLWLDIVAEQIFGVIVPEATYAATSVVLTNAGGGYYTIEAGDLTFKNSLTGKTYTNTSGGILASGPGTTLTVSVEAEEPGSASSASATEIDELITGLLGVTCSNPVAAVGVDKQDESVTRQQCRDKLGSLSQNGPKEAYSYVARNFSLTGTRAVTRVRVYSASDTGDVTMYLAGPSGGTLAPDRTLVEAAVLRWATPLCITPAVLSATNVVVPITYELWLYQSVNKTALEVQADVAQALQQMLATRPIGGDIVPPLLTGALYQSLVESTIRSVYTQAFRVNVTAPAGDVALANGEVAVLGVVTPTIHFVANP